MNCLFLKSAGPLDQKQMRAMIRSGSQLDLYQHGVRIFHDLSLVRFPDDFGPLKALADSLPLDHQHAEMALVDPSDLGQRMLSTYAGVRNVRHQMHRAFRSAKDALEWLQIGGPDHALPATVADVFQASVTEQDRDVQKFQMVVRRLD